MARDRVRVCVPDVGGDDGRHDGALGSADDPHVRPRRPTGESAGKPLAATGWFAAGYLLAWIGFSLAATLLQWVLEREALLDPRMAIASNLLGAIVLIAAGVYQWTPLKDVCLAQCQSPLRFLMRHGGFRSDLRGCLLLGLRHGAYCVGCCWVLMALLFVVGVMNVLWIALLALLVLLEKLTPGTMGRACRGGGMCRRGRFAAGVPAAVMSNPLNVQFDLPSATPQV